MRLNGVCIMVDTRYNFDICFRFKDCRGSSASASPAEKIYNEGLYCGADITFYRCVFFG